MYTENRLQELLKPLGYMAYEKIAPYPKLRDNEVDTNIYYIKGFKTPIMGCSVWHILSFNPNGRYISSMLKIEIPTFANSADYAKEYRVHCFGVPYVDENQITLLVDRAQWAFDELTGVLPNASMIIY